MASKKPRDSPSHHVTVVDVYDLAAMIGKDFEHLIELYGADCVTNLMPKVVSSLEMLEAFAGRNEQENDEIVSLKKTIQSLEAEKRERLEGREKFEKELEKIEENYRIEITELWSVVQKLQEENKKLAVAVEQSGDAPGTPTTASHVIETDMKFLLKLQETVDKQKEQLKEFRQESEALQREVDNLRVQVEKITRINKELLRKNSVVQTQGRLLVEEKSDLISQIQFRDKIVEQLRERLGHAERAFKDEVEQSTSPRPPEFDDSVPRFTLAELREVLEEKNKLKARMLELESEFDRLKGVSPAPPVVTIDEGDVEDLPVQGPINREPEEKLYPWKPRRTSGIRKFFRSFKVMLANENSEMTTSPSFELADSASTPSRTHVKFPPN